MSKIAVLIPCYNEAFTIAKVISDFRRVLPDADIYVYDNNSTDDTAQIASTRGAIVRREYRQGKGNVIRSMFRDITADCFILADGDDTYPADAAPEMVRKVLDEHMDMVIGDRLSSTYYTENKRPFHNAGNNLVRWLVNRIFHGHVADIMTGYRAFSYGFVKTFPVLSKGFEIETEMTIHALDKNLPIASIPIRYQDRPIGSESKLNTFSDGMRVLLTIVSLFKECRPMRYFLLIAALFGLVSVGFFLPAFLDYVQTGLVFHTPSLFVSGVAATLSILHFICGLILDAVAIKHRQLFETNFTMAACLHNLQNIANKEG